MGIVPSDSLTPLCGAFLIECEDTMKLWKIVSSDRRNIYGMTSIYAHTATKEMAERFCKLLNERAIDRTYWVEECT